MQPADSTPTMFPTDPASSPPSQTPPTPAISPKPPKKKGLLIGIIAGGILLVGVIVCLILFLPGSNKEDNQSANNSNSSSDNAKTADVKTCDKFTPNPNLVTVWPDAVWASLSSGDDCASEMTGSIELDLVRESNIDGIGYVLKINGGTYGADGVEDAHKVTVSNVEVIQGGKTYPFSEFLVTDPAVYVEYLEHERYEYEAYVESYAVDGYWDKAFGGVLPFEDLVIDGSRLGETVVIGPAIEPDAYGTGMDSYGRRWYFAFDPSVSALKFDLTVDGKTKTIAFDLGQ